MHVSDLQAKDDFPLCVNCDEALLKTNIFFEAFFLIIKRNPLFVFLLPFWLIGGKQGLRVKISNCIGLNWPLLPLNGLVVATARSALAANRRVVLLTSLPANWAAELASALACGKSVLVREIPPSARIEVVASELVRLFGPQGFDYIGGGQRDRPIREVARQVTVVPSVKTGPLTYLRMIRVHQWLKNFLICVPLLAAHKLTAPSVVGTAALGFLAFSFCASSVYVLNDLLDLDSDRQHIRKRNRPIAAGTISVDRAFTVGFSLLVSAAWLSLEVSRMFALTVGFYFMLTLAYSLRLKRQVVVDVMLLATLYTIRIVAGAVAADVIPSFWLLAFSMFLFLSLAVVKRYSEMLVTLAEEKKYAAGRGYSVEDMAVLLSLGIGTGIAAIVVLALYINDPTTSRIYPTTILLWPVPPLLLYWIIRVWMKAHRGEMHDDPVIFAMRDWQSIVVLILAMASFATATFL